MEEKTSSVTKGAPSIAVDEILVSAVEAVVSAQQTLDAQSIASEIKIREEGLDEKYGLSAKWYTIPELNLDFRLAFEIGDRGEVSTQMVDAEYQSKYGFDMKASSLLQTKILAVPPPEIMGISLLEEEDVLKKISEIKSIVEAYDRCDTPYFIFRYNPFSHQGYAGGLWFGKLIDNMADGRTKVRAVAVVDDANGNVIRLWTDKLVKTYDITLTQDEALSALIAVNKATKEELITVFNIQEAKSAIILENRPFDNFKALADLDGVGKVTLNKIYDYIKNRED